ARRGWRTRYASAPGRRRPPSPPWTGQRRTPSAPRRARRATPGARPRCPWAPPGSARSGPPAAPARAPGTRRGRPPRRTPPAGTPASAVLPSPGRWSRGDYLALADHGDAGRGDDEAAGHVVLLVDA